jgi:hypothetical protein
MGSSFSSNQWLSCSLFPPIARPSPQNLLTRRAYCQYTHKRDGPKVFTKNKVVDSQNKVADWIALIEEACRDIRTTLS